MRNSFIATAAMFCSVQALAVEPDFRIATTTLQYNLTTTKTTPKGGTADEGKSGGLQMPVADYELYAAFAPYNLYLYPFSGSAILSYTFAENMEAGLAITTLKSTSTKANKDAKELASSNLKLGPYYAMVMPMGKNALELTGILSLTSTSEQSLPTDATTVVKTESSGYALNLDACYVMPIMKNFDYAAGLNIDISSNTAKVDGTEVATVGGTVINLNLLKFRARF